MVNRPSFIAMLLHSIKITDTKFNKEENVYSLDFVELLMILMQSPDLIISKSSYKTLYNLLNNKNN